MDIGNIKNILGKAKLYAMKKRFIESLELTLQALQVINSESASLPSELRGAIREVVQFYAQDASMKESAGSSLAYTPGQEKALYILLKKTHQVLTDNKFNESYDQARSRKQQLDKYLILGKSYLAANDVSKADQAFNEGIKFYKDETTLFPYIAKMLMDVNQSIRALFYLKKAVESNPSDAGSRALIEQILKQRSS